MNDDHDNAATDRDMLAKLTSSKSITMRVEFNEEISSTGEYGVWIDDGTTEADLIGTGEALDEAMADAAKTIAEWGFSEVAS